MNIFKKVKFEDVRLCLYIISIIIITTIYIFNIPTSCYLRDNFGILCPACGLTRATISILNFKFVDAFYYNEYYTIILVPMVIIFFINDIYCIFKRKILKKKTLSLVEIVFGEGKYE